MTITDADREGLTDEIAEAINDSLDMDWQPKWAAPAIIAIIERECIAAEQAGARKWQPIETAPRDGTPVIIISMSAPEPAAFVAHFAQDASWGNEPAWLIGHKWERGKLRTPALGKAYAELVGVIGEPTHWKPLPEPPALDPEEICK